jgi:TorA maturation chaperone TorD
MGIKNQSFQPLMKVSRLRETLYSFFSRVFMKEADLPFLDALPCILPSIEQLFEYNAMYRESDIQEGEEIFRQFLGKVECSEPQAVLTDLARDYAALFLGVGRQTVALCESVYRGGTGLLLQTPYFEVKKRYEQSSFVKWAGFSEPEDHLSLQLAYMAHLCCLTMEEMKPKGGESVKYLRLQDEFLRFHFGNWIPVFSDTLKKCSHSGLYRAMAYLLNGFIIADGYLVDAVLRGPTMQG